MLKETDIVTVVCDSCGHESQQEIRGLKTRAGRSGLICGACGISLEDYAQRLGFMIEHEDANPFRKFRLHAARGK